MKPISTKLFAIFWLIISLIGLGYVILAQIRFAPYAGKADDMGLGFVIILIGLPCVIELVLAILLLLAKKKSIRKLLTVALGLVPAILLIASGWLTIAIVIMTAFAFYFENKQYLGNPNKSV